MWVVPFLEGIYETGEQPNGNVGLKTAINKLLSHSIISVENYCGKLPIVVFCVKRPILLAVKTLKHVIRYNTLICLNLADNPLN